MCVCCVGVLHPEYGGREAPSHPAPAPSPQVPQRSLLHQLGGVDSQVSGRRATPERTGTHRNAPERTGTHRNAPERTGTHRNAPERTGTHRNAPERTGTHRNAPERTGTHRNAPERNVSERNKMHSLVRKSSCMKPAPGLLQL